VVAKRKTGTLKIKNPNYTQSERRHELFDSFKAKTYQHSDAPAHPKEATTQGRSRSKKEARTSRRARLNFVAHRHLIKTDWPYNPGSMLDTFYPALTIALGLAPGLWPSNLKGGPTVSLP
jgi:hypothetical protein